MRQIIELIKRNSRIYFRDKNAVVFSLLTMMIVMALMAFFLGNGNVKSIVGIFEEYGVTDLDNVRENAEVLVLMWTIAGIISVNAVNVSLAVIGNMVSDVKGNRFQSFCTSPVKRSSIAVGYIGAAAFCASVMCMITLVIAEIIAAVNGAEILSVMSHIKLIGMIILNSFVYSCIMYFVAIFVKSESSWSGFGTVVGTLVGFLGGIYLPIGALPDGVQNVLKVTPVFHSCTMIRDVLTENEIAHTFADMPQDVIDKYKEVMGVTVCVNDTIVDTKIQVALIFICGIIFLTAAAFIMKKKSVSDR